MNTNRREFLQTTTGVGAMMALGGTAALRAQTTEAASKKTLRVGFVGAGNKGSSHLGNLLRMEGVEVRAVCDIVELQCRETQEQAKRLGLRPPTAYSRGERDFERMCAEEELDLVYNATPWQWHVPVCLAAMRHGKHAATEVPAARTIEECWELVETSEKSGKHCSMMENVNYYPDELTILSMVRRGLLGELTHCEAGYLHDTRQLKMNDFGDGLWLGNDHATRNGNLYPTHGLGPLAWYLDINRGDRLDINRGDRLDYLVSMSSKARGLDLFAAAHLPPGHPKRERKYINGDVNTCLIRTANGVTITLTHDSDSPRPYSRINHVQGTKGLVVGFPKFSVCLEVEGNAHPEWMPGENFRAKYEHPLWKEAVERHAKQPNITKDFGPILPGAVWNYDAPGVLQYGDFIEDYRLVEAHRAGVAPDFDVYDGVTWSVVAALSEKSVANRSAAVDFPDFTKGKWKTAPPIKLMGV